MLGISPSRLALVAVHPWDVQGAQAAGLLGTWVNRQGARYPTFIPAPDVTGRDLVHAVDNLLALPA